MKLNICTSDVRVGYTQLNRNLINLIEEDSQI